MIMDVYYDKLSEHCEVFSGYAFKSQDLLTEGEIPVVKIGNISNGRDLILDKDTQYVDKIFLSINEKYHIKKGDVLISLTGSHINQPNSMVGRSCRYYKNQELLLNQRAGKILAKTNNDLSFLYYMFSSWAMKVSITNRAYGAANQANVSPSDILSIKFNFPNYECQKKIGLILSRYDEAIENNNKRMKLLEQMAQNLYKEWFVRFRFPGYENCEFENGIPVGWKVEKLGNFCKITDGTHDTPAQVEEGIPLVTGKAIINGRIDFSIPYNISVEDHEKIKKRSGLKTGDILFSNIGTIGNVCLVNYDREFSVKNMIIFKPESINQSMYLFYLLNSDSIQSLFTAQTNGASQQFLGLDFMRRFKILLPSEEIIKLFGEKEVLIIQQINIFQQQNQNLAKQRDLLLPRLMSGKLEVK